VRDRANERELAGHTGEWTEPVSTGFSRQSRYILTMHNNLCILVVEMEFDFDPEKSRTNLAKHGIDFEHAQQLWSDSSLLILPSRFLHEARYLAIGRIDGRFWTTVFTERSNVIRLISVRRSRTEEKTLYERNLRRKS